MWEAVAKVRTELQAALHLAETLSPTEMPVLLGELEQVRVTALARLSAPTPAPSTSDEMLDIRAASKRLGMSRDYLYRHHEDLPFARRIGRKVLFSSAGIDKYLSRK